MKCLKPLNLTNKIIQDQTEQKRMIMQPIPVICDQRINDNDNGGGGGR